MLDGQELPVHREGQNGSGVPGLVDVQAPLEPDRVRAPLHAAAGRCRSARRDCSTTTSATVW